jgi:hypothetical protein
VANDLLRTGSRIDADDGTSTVAADIGDDDVSGRKCGTPNLLIRRLRPERCHRSLTEDPLHGTDPFFEYALGAGQWRR